jgi:hypothetical protein
MAEATTRSNAVTKGNDIFVCTPSDRPLASVVVDLPHTAGLDSAAGRLHEGKSLVPASPCSLLPWASHARRSKGVLIASAICGRFLSYLALADDFGDAGAGRRACAVAICLMVIGWTTFAVYHLASAAAGRATRRRGARAQVDAALVVSVIVRALISVVGLALHRAAKRRGDVAP